MATTMHAARSAAIAGKRMTTLKSGSSGSNSGEMANSYSHPASQYNVIMSGG